MKSIFPTFFIIGAQKSGTTTLHDLLEKEGLVELPVMKETHFFSDTSRYGNGINWYYECFNVKKNGCFRGEVDPDYLFFDQAPERIAKLITDPKIVVVLRHPLHRAYSHYKMSVRRGLENLSFKDALNCEKDRILNDYSNSLKHHSYFSRGQYSNQILHWMQCLPKANFHFVKFDNLIDDKTKAFTYYNICSHIGFQSKLSGSQLDIISNPASSPRFQIVANLFWGNTGLKKVLRPIIHRVLPNKRFRGHLASLIDGLNCKTMERTSGVKDEIPRGFKDMVNQEIIAAQNVTKLNLSNWLLK